MDVNKEDNEAKESPQRFLNLLEAGSLAYSEIIEYAFVVFGITKHGKTTLSHHLVHNSLYAYMNKTYVHYKLAQTKGNHAKIGEKMYSYTEIPNKFSTEIKINEHILHVIDNPGHLDSFGINRVLSNAYFHYRVFSKVKNMKFILVFDSHTFTKNVGETNAIFKLFFYSFTNFQYISDQILKSIAIIFTKVDRDSSLRDFEYRLYAYEDTFYKNNAFDYLQIKFLSKLFKYCKNNYRIKLFWKADLKHEVGKCEFLKYLNKKLSFFTRYIDETYKSVLYFYHEKRVKMDNIKFSYTKKVQNLTNDDYTKNQMTQLFYELTSRAYNMFGAFFNFIYKLVTFLLFEYDKCENVGNSVDKSEMLKLSRQNFLRNLALGLYKYMISYEEYYKYKKSRQLIVYKYKSKLKYSAKVYTFIERLNLASKLVRFCLDYSNTYTFTKRYQSYILACLKDIETIFLAISGMYSNSEYIERLAKFFYDIKNYMDQLIIFCMIILPDEKEGLYKIKKFLMYQPLDRFLKCLDGFNEKSSHTYDVLTQSMMKEFSLSKEYVHNIDSYSLIKIYLVKHPNLLVDNKYYSYILLKNLIKTSLTEDQKIYGVTLMFNTLKDHYNRFMHFKKIVDPKNKNSLIPQYNFQPKNLKKMILSFVELLKQVKKVKDLLNCKSFEKHRIHTYQMNSMCWNSIVKLFILLIECQNIKSKKEKYQYQYKINSMPSIDRISPIKNSPIRKQYSMNMNSKNEIAYKSYSIENLQEIIIELLWTHPNVGFIEYVYGKLINVHREEFESVTLQSCALKINKTYRKSLSGHYSYCMVMLDEEKKTCAYKMIDILLKFASNLNEYYLKDKALAKCHYALRYVEYCQYKLSLIEDKIYEIYIHNNIGGWIQSLKEQKKINEFEPSMVAKRLLTKFSLDNTEVKLLDCVKFEIFI